MPQPDRIIDETLMTDDAAVARHLSTVRTPAMAARELRFEARWDELTVEYGGDWERAHDAAFAEVYGP